MKKHLNAYIDKYIQDADEPDKKVARHLKEIIPKTTHVDKNILDEIVEELKKEIERGGDFKNSFLKVCKKYILAGDTIDAPLPDLLTRIILDDTEFIEKINEERGIPSDREDIRDIVGMLALDTAPFHDNQPLTAVCIRYKNSNDVLKIFPAFPDAGWYNGFYPSEKTDKYGRTKSREPSLKCMPEIVHENLRLAVVIKEIRFLFFRE